jgi:NAD(P)-dependent dehydrogenase (short-subunit alcohol dehydrogenase family)
MFDLTGQVALVTGGSRGLGREMATAFALQGADVAICSRHEEELSAAAEAIRAETGRRVLAISADVTQVADVTRLAEAVLAEFGRVEILVNNAGSNIRRPLLEFTDEEWSSVLRVCLDSAFYVSRAIVPQMVRAGYGRVINISSSLGAIALPERGPYCASKGALLQLTRVMALEWAEHGVNVNTICPGPFRTPYNLRLAEMPEVFESYLGLIPQHRWAELSEIRGAAVFLASREASFVTGSALYVDGGWTAHSGIPLPGATDPRGRSR